MLCPKTTRRDKSTERIPSKRKNRDQQGLACAKPDAEKRDDRAASGMASEASEKLQLPADAGEFAFLAEQATCETKSNFSTRQEERSQIGRRAVLLFLECGAFPPLWFDCYSLKTPRNKAAEKRRTPKNYKVAPRLILHLDRPEIDHGTIHLVEQIISAESSCLSLLRKEWPQAAHLAGSDGGGVSGEPLDCRGQRRRNGSARGAADEAGGHSRMGKRVSIREQRTISNQLVDSRSAAAPRYRS